jgi:hypothetical protein
MADRKISDLTALTTPASGDYLPIVDISEAAAASKNKRITIEELMRGVPDGTAAAPGIAFETDPNTGIYSPGADQLAVATNGTGRLFVDSVGNVGTNVTPFAYTASARNLQVNGTGYAALTFGTTNGGTDEKYWRWIARTASPAKTLVLQTLDDSGGGEVNAYTLTRNGTAIGYHAWSAGGSERLRITSAGLVGIGTSAPVFNLVVAGSGSDGAWFNSSGTTGRMGLGAIANGAAGAFQISYDRGTGLANFGVGTRDTPSTAFTVDSSGRLGIGTTSPVANLDVLVNSASDSEIRVSNSIDGLRLLTQADGTQLIRSVFNRGLIFGSGTSTLNSTFVERMRIDSSGRLLVGTSTGSAAVHIGNSVDSLIMDRVGDVAGASIAAFRKSRGVVGTPAIVFTEDTLGTLNYSGFDGSNYIIGARILAQVDGTPGANDMPCRLIFSTTADGAASPTERMRIKSAGTINFSNVSTYADNTAALAGGLVAGDVYRKSDGTLMITY